MVYSCLEFAYISSTRTGGQGCSASFTLEWFSLREGGNLLPALPTYPHRLCRGAKPAWEMGPTCVAWLAARPGCCWAGKPCSAPSPTSRQLRPFRQSSQEVAAPLPPRAVPVDQNGMGGKRVKGGKEGDTLLAPLRRPLLPILFRPLSGR